MLSVARRPSPVASPVAVAGPWNALACDARADAASAAMQKRSVMHGLCKLDSDTALVYGCNGMAHEPLKEVSAK